MGFVSVCLRLAVQQSMQRPDALEVGATGMKAIARDVCVKQVAPHTWMYSFVHKLDDGTVYPANGIAFKHGKRVVLVDPGWDATQAKVIENWCRNTLGRVSAVIVTHFHADRSGGAPQFARRNIPVYASAETVRLVPSGVKAGVNWHAIDGLTAGKVVDRAGLKICYPGPGHTSDNIVVYVPGDQVMYGGCFLKSVTSATLGNIADAKLDAWPESIIRLCCNFPYRNVVIPGHGTISGDSINHTAILLKAHSIQNSSATKAGGHNRTP